MASFPAVAGFVLAGGKSSRMGSDKALLELGGVTLVFRAVTKLAVVCGSVAIAGGSAELRRYGKLLPDIATNCGPLSGIVTGLASTSLEHGLFIAVDLPLVPAAFLEELCARALRSTAIAVVPVVSGVPQPLCAIYRRSALPSFREALEAGRWKMMAAAAEAGPVERFDVPAGEERLFFNANTPEQWGEVKDVERP